MSIVSPNRYPYETVAASQTAQVLGGTGAVGDYLHRLVVTVNTAATGTVSVLDGSTAVMAVPANTVTLNDMWQVHDRTVSRRARI